MDQAELYLFIARQRLAVLSSVTRQSWPQSALIGIAVTGELEIIFDTLKTSRKYLNLLAEPACSLVIGWTDEQTLQFEGIAQELKSDDLENYQRVYFETWPECRAHQSWPEITYFVVKPRWIRYSDFDQKPPLLCEFQFPPLPKAPFSAR